MIKSKTILSLFLVIALTFSVLTGCGKAITPEASDTPGTPSSNTPSTVGFNFSDGLDANGFWNNIKAKDYVELAKYSGISIPTDIHTVTDESVQTQVDELLSQYPTKNQITDRAVKDGDTVNIDYVGSIDSVPFDGGNTNGLGTEVTIGVTNYIDDFLEQLIGHNPGESFDVNVTFPEDYGVENLNGKDAVFTVTINHIVESVKSELTDKFVADNFSATYGWNNISEMKTFIRDYTRNQAITEYIQKYLTDNSTIKSIPDSIIKYNEDALVQSIQSYADSYSMELNDYLSTFEGVANKEELLSSYKELNTNSAKLYLIVQAVAEDAKITVSDNDVLEYFKENMGTDDYSSYEDYFGMPYLKLIVLNQAVLDYLQDNAVLE